MTNKIPEKYIKKLGLHMSDDLEYAAFVDAETKTPIVCFPGRDFLQRIINLLCLLNEEIGEEKLKRFLNGEKLQK